MRCWDTYQIMRKTGKAFVKYLCYKGMKNERKTMTTMRSDKEFSFILAYTLHLSTQKKKSRIPPIVVHSPLGPNTQSYIVRFLLNLYTFTSEWMWRERMLKNAEKEWPRLIIYFMFILLHLIEFQIQFHSSSDRFGFFLFAHFISYFVVGCGCLITNINFSILRIFFQHLHH